METRRRRSKAHFRSPILAPAPPFLALALLPRPPFIAPSAVSRCSCPPQFARNPPTISSPQRSIHFDIQRACGDDIDCSSALTLNRKKGHASAYREFGYKLMNNEGLKS